MSGSNDNRTHNGKPIGSERFNTELKKIWKKIDEMSDSINTGFSQLNDALIGNKKYRRRGIIDQVESNNDNIKEVYNNYQSLHKSVTKLRSCVESIENDLGEFDMNDVNSKIKSLNELKETVYENKSFVDKRTGAAAALAIIMSAISLAMKFFGG